jgi:hypothetical protein
MTRVAAVVILVLLNALAFGITGSASSSQASPQDAELARQAAVARKARDMAPGTPVRIERLDGTKTDAILDRVLPDAIDVLLVVQDRRTPATIPLAEIKRVQALKGHALRNFAIAAGVTVTVAVAVLFGLCAGSVG